MFQKYILYKEGIDVNYTLPSNPQEQMADFYCVSLLNSINFIIHGDFPNYNKNEMDRNDILKYELNLTTKTLLTSLKQSLLEDLYYVICSEICHYNEETYIKDYDELNKKEIKFTKEELIKYSDFLEAGNHDYRYEYLSSVIPHYFSTKEDFVKYCYKQFAYSKWMVKYGGYQWMEICDAYLKLLNVKNENLLFIYIDHVYDLEHNTGMVFDKLEKYTINGSHRWIQLFLDFKKNIDYASQLLEFCSPKMKNLAKRIIVSSKEKEKYNKEEFNTIIKLDGKIIDHKISKYILYDRTKNISSVSNLLKEYENIKNNFDGITEIFFDLNPYLQKFVKGKYNKTSAELRFIAYSIKDEIYLNSFNFKKNPIGFLNALLEEESNQISLKDIIKNIIQNKSNDKSIAINFLHDKTLINKDICNKIVENTMQLYQNFY